LLYVIVKTLATAGAAAAVTALALAVPAQADPPSFNGRYSIVGGANEFYWTVTSPCATEGCTASIISNRGWTSVATQTGGRWTFSMTKPDSIVCSDGTFAPIVIRYSLDATSLAGMATADSNGDCPGGQETQIPVQLSKVG
jgi:hypothetical protein